MSSHTVILSINFGICLIFEGNDLLQIWSMLSTSSPVIELRNQLFSLDSLANDPNCTGLSYKVQVRIKPTSVHSIV